MCPHCHLCRCPEDGQEPELVPTPRGQQLWINLLREGQLIGHHTPIKGSNSTRQCLLSHYSHPLLCEQFSRLNHPRLPVSALTPLRHSSSCSIRDRGRKRTVPHIPKPMRPGAQLKARGPMGTQWWTGDGTGSPAAKQARSDAGSAHVEDWYSPPVLPLEPCEYWLHEDCGIWSAGVFLVKGKVYGLEEAVKAAQEMMCSACCNPGATLGCFFKSCPNKYHYRCALESGEWCPLPSSPHNTGRGVRQAKCVLILVHV
uniref:PHD-type domain-containing protein n=1 Tax=Mola mola TaxID=94237 RepID=A0A3Q4BY82_MOLML